MSGSKENFRERLEQLGKIYIDGAEQNIRRPSDSVDQKRCYSGKKKNHTVKTLVISGPDKKIEGITEAYVGSSHDFAILKEEKLYEVLPSKTPIYLDTGFEGVDNLGNDLNFKKPKKKKRGRKLNGGEKLGNRIISKERVKVEHAIGGMKTFRIVSSKFRGITRSMDRTFQIAAGLWNLKLMLKNSNAIP